MTLSVTSLEAHPIIEIRCKKKDTNYGKQFISRIILGNAVQDQFYHLKLQFLKSLWIIAFKN